MQTKKLTLTSKNKPELISALQAAACLMDADMRRIYDMTIEEINAVNDKIELTEAQQEIVKYALALHVMNHGEIPEVTRMQVQLTMSHRDYMTWLSTQAGF